MDIMQWVTTENLNYALAFFLVAFGVQAFYFIFKSAEFPYRIEFPEKPLEEREEARLDNLLATGRKFHNWSFIFAGLLIALSALDNVSELKSPIGEVSIPIIPTSIGLYILVIITVIIADRFLFLAFPWVALDKRRPPFDWLVFGFDFKNQIHAEVWEILPILVAAVGLSIIFTSQSFVNDVATTSVIFVAGLTLSQIPRTMSSYYYLILNKIDHRGGNATFSTFLLYVYRLLGIILFSAIVSLPIILIIPQWYSEALDRT
jgi:hypothetical protein